MNKNKLIQEWKWTVLGVFVILFVGFLLRIINLTILPVFADEAIYVRWSQVMASEPTLRFLPLSDGKQPLYMWILMFVVKYFSDPLFIGRLISVLSGIATTIGVFTASYLLFKNKKLSIFASLAYVLSPFTFFFDRLALVDSLLASLTVWTFVFSYLTFKNNRLDFALITGIILGLASLTKSPAIFTASLIPLFFVFNKDIQGVLKKPSILIKPFLLTLVIYLISFVMYNIQRLGPNFDMLVSRTADYTYPLSHLFTNPTDPLIPHLKDYLSWLLILGPFPVIILFILGIVEGFKSFKKELFVLLVFTFFAVYVESAIGKVFTARYVLFTIPFFVIISSLSFLNKNKILKTISYLTLFLFVVLSLKNNYFLLTNPEKANIPIGERAGYLEEWTAGQGIKEVSDYITEEFKKDNTNEIVVGTEGYFGTLPDGLQIYLNNLPNTKVKVIGVGLAIDNVPENLQKSVEYGSKTYLVINKSRYLGKGEGLKLIKSFKKANRNPKSDNYKNMGPYDELLFFEVINK